MQITPAAGLADDPAAQAAADLARRCVHCGLCLPACPTYRLLGDELDSPRGRVYLVKAMLESGAANEVAQRHLSRCLTCRACETACPSGVQYGKIADFGREFARRRTPRSEKIARFVIAETISRPPLLRAAVAAIKPFRSVLPAALKRRLPAADPSPPPMPMPPSPPLEALDSRRAVIVPDGCAQSALAPEINRALARLLAKIGIATISAKNEGCCGALHFHLDFQKKGRALMRRNLRAWTPPLESGRAFALVSTASGCGATIKQYGDYLGSDGAAVAAKTVDAAELIAAEWDALAPHLTDDENRGDGGGGEKIVFQAPCTLRHGQKIAGVVEDLLTKAGFDLVAADHPAMCCGSAGAYSLLQPAISRRLRGEKLRDLLAGGASRIVTANIGCLLHLRAATTTPVLHWLNLLAEKLR